MKILFKTLTWLLIAAGFLCAAMCQSPKPSPSLSTSTEIKPGKYNVTFTGQMTVEEIGVVVPPDTIPTPPVPTTPGDAASKFGSCSFAWTPVEKMGAFTFVNTFISADFISTSTGIFVEPIWKARTNPDGGLDSWIKALNDKGCTPLLCINQTPSWMFASTSARSPKNALQSASISNTYDPHADFKQFAMRGQWGRYGAQPIWKPGQRGLPQSSASEQWVPDHPPLKPGASRTDPNSYREYARIFGELAKRYGSVKHPESSLWVNTTSRWTNDGPNKKLSGLGYKFALTVWNEPDRFWHKGDGSGVYMEPEEYAALFAACFEAVKAADPNVPCLMAGLTGTDMDYMTRFINALKAMGKPLPDALVLHKYCHKGNEAGKHPPTWYDSGACAPELDKSFNDIKAFVTYAKSLSRPLCVTEFGTDTRPPSWMYAPPFAGKSSETIQAEWICRTYLEYLRLGVDKISMFNGNDEAGAINGGLYTNSGLLYGEGEPGKVFQPKPSYAAVTALVSILRGMRFTKDESTATARIMRFDSNTKAVWVYWSPTADGRTFQTAINGQSVTVTEAPKFLSVGQ